MTVHSVTINFWTYSRSFVGKYICFEINRKTLNFALSSNSISSVNGVLWVWQNMRPNYTTWKRLKPFPFSTISLTSSSGEGYQNPGFQGGYHLQGVVGYPFSSCQTKLRGLSVESLKRSNNWASNATNVFLNPCSSSSFCWKWAWWWGWY